MPTLSVFIRKDDVEKWKALENKSESIHKLLNGDYHTLEFVKGSDIAKELLNPFVGNNKIIPTQRSISPIDNSSSAVEFAEQNLGPKCCQNTTKPCQHWQWNETELVFINSLTGATREPVA